MLGEMAVQQWQERSTGEDIPSAYSDLLIDINKCLHQCNTLETGRSYSQRVIDWAAGMRGNIPRLIKLMEELKEEVKNGSNLFNKLLRRINELKLLDMSDRNISKYASDTMNSYENILRNSYSLFAQAIVNLQEFGVIIRKEMVESMEQDVSLAHALLAVPALLTPGVEHAFSAGMLGYGIALIDNPKLMGALKTAHHTAEDLIGQVDELIKDCDAKAIEYKARRKEKVEQRLDYEIEQLERKTRSITLQRNSAEDSIKAAKIFYGTEREELQDLASTEPDMSEDSRKRMARKAAIRNCKTFLTEGLRYSNDEADELINNIQN